MSSQYEAYIGQAAQAGNQYLNKVQGQTVPGETATQVLSETMQKADKLISRILHLSNRLCGAEPTSMCAGQDESKQADGVLPAIKDQNWEIQRRLSQAEYALDRIEALL